MIVQSFLLVASLLFIADVAGDPIRASSPPNSPLAQFKEFYELGIELRSLVNREVDGNTVRFVAPDRFEVLTKLTTDMEREGDLEEAAKQLEMDETAKQEYRSEWEEAKESDSSVFRLAVYTSYVYGALTRFFGGIGKSKDVDADFAMLKEELFEKFGLQAVLDAKDEENKRAIEAVAEKMAKGQMCLRAGKLTMGKVNAWDVQEYMYQNVVVMIGKTFRFYFAKDKLKFAEILNQKEFGELSKHFHQQLGTVKAQLAKAPSGDGTLVKLGTLMHFAERLLNRMDEFVERHVSMEVARIRKREFDEIWTGMQDAMRDLEILKPANRKIDWEFALEMALGKHPKAEHKKAFDTLLGGEDKSTELFQNVGKILMQFYYKRGKNFKKLQQA